VAQHGSTGRQRSGRDVAVLQPATDVRTTSKIARSTMVIPRPRPPRARSTGPQEALLRHARPTRSPRRTHYVSIFASARPRVGLDVRYDVVVDCYAREIAAGDTPEQRARRSLSMPIRGSTRICHDQFSHRALFPAGAEHRNGS